MLDKSNQPSCDLISLFHLAHVSFEVHLWILDHEKTENQAIVEFKYLGKINYMTWLYVLLE